MKEKVKDFGGGVVLVKLPQDMKPLDHIVSMYEVSTSTKATKEDGRYTEAFLQMLPRRWRRIS